MRGALFTRLLGDMLRVVAILVGLQLFVFNFSLVRGSSMRPNIFDGDRLIVDKLTYSIYDIDRFDVVILSCPREIDIDYVKRIVGLPGDEVELIDGRLYVNGTPVREKYGAVRDKTACGVWRVPNDHYFVLGDNRPVSSDSREGWFVPHDNVRGKVRACVWPLSRVRVF